MYIGRPIYISDVRYLYPTSDIPALALALAEYWYCVSDVRYRYRTSDIGTRMWDIARYPDVGYRYQDVGYRHPVVGYRYPDVRYIYWRSDIYIRCPI